VYVLDEPLEPLIPLEELKEGLAGLTRVPKSAVSKPKPESKKPG
jgi:hypothetical protein